MAEVAIVTGASRGIGAATARLLSARGYRVCVNYRTEPGPARALCAEIEAGGGRGGRPATRSMRRARTSEGTRR